MNLSIKNAFDDRRRVWKKLADELVALIPEEAQELAQGIFCKEYEELPDWLDRLIEKTQRGLYEEWIIRTPHPYGCVSIQQVVTRCDQLADAWKDVIEINASDWNDEVEIRFYAVEFDPSKETAARSL